VRKFQHNDFAIKTQEGGLPDFFQGRETAWAITKNTAKTLRPGGGRIIACLSKSNDKLTPACKKVLADAKKK
jgi:hypothetical protein